MAERFALEQVASHARTRRILAWVAAGAVVSLAALTVATHFRWPAPTAVVIAMIAMIAMSVAAFVRFRSRPITTLIVARSLDAAVSQLERSAALLLTSPTEGTPIERLQRRRAAAVLTQLDRLPPLPDQSSRVAALVAIASVMAAALALAIPRRDSSAPRVTPSAADQQRLAALQVRRITVTATPPAYTHRKTSTHPAGDVTVEAGSGVEWDIDAPAATAVRIIFASGDTVHATPDTNGTWHATWVALHPAVWRAEASNGRTTVHGDDHLLAVLPDREPTATILAPLGRVELEWNEPHRITVRALVSDDYGIPLIRLGATVASGNGEGVRFHESWLKVVTESQPDATSRVVSRDILLDSLHVQPGDEVLVAIEATDNALVPHVTRSETVFITVRDTISVADAAIAGVSIRVEPAYFRSQRQIILDTEALLRDARERRVRDPSGRAIEIGNDQRLLRLRYTEFLGGESSDGSDATAAHDHDAGDNATLLSNDVKAALRRALDAMWAAERELSVGRANPALPHEYRALAALEDVRHAERSYVRRLGFTLPPLDTAKSRLSRTADRLAPAVDTVTQLPLDPDAPLLLALASLNSPDAVDRGTLEAAATRLAERAMTTEPARHLATLRALRAILDGGCNDCVANARRGLLAALPAPPTPIRPLRQAREVP